MPSSAHPRSRGENHENVGLDKIVGGSSPLTRGKPGHGCHDRARFGLIPAHAGKTRPFSTLSVGVRAHPRSRGENARVATPPWMKCGSSPLTRGKPTCGSVSIRPVGLIPAHAGKTAWRAARSSLSAAHPRSRGENIVSGAQPRRGPGSSPLTRGKRGLTALTGLSPGLIPAHAGKTATDR